MKRFKLIWLLFTDPSFRYYLKYTLFYAINVHKKNGGVGASDVLVFDAKYSDEIFNSDELEKEKELFHRAEAVN